MATSIGFYLSAVIAAGIIFIGGRFLVAPSLAAATDERYAVAFRTALRGLSRLGLELEAVAPCRSRSLTPPAECSDDRYA